MLFVFACAIPTLITVSVVVVTATPWYSDYLRDGIQRELSRHLGVTVLIDAVEYPAPKTIRLVGIKLLEPETQAEIGRVRSATWISGDTKAGIQLSQPELQSEHLQYAWRLIHDRFLCQPELTAVPVRVAANDLTIHSGTGSVTFRDVDSWIRPLENRIEAMIQCVPAARRDDAPIHITVVRDRSGRSASTDWTLQTGDLSLPCSALADYMPPMRNLGAEATFTGTLNWKIADSGWAIDLGGSRFDDLELAEMLHSVPHRLTGRASIKFERCLVLPGESVDVSGTIVSNSGYIGQSFIRAAHTHLGFDIAPLADGEARDILYDRIALRFDLFGPQLTLAGICHQQRGYEYLPNGAVVASSGHAIVGSRSEPQSWASLVRTFWQDGRENLPISGQSAWLMSFLPSPQRPVAGTSAAPRITGTGLVQGEPSISQPD
jgi:hypothetical protein